MFYIFIYLYRYLNSTLNENRGEGTHSNIKEFSWIRYRYAYISFHFHKLTSLEIQMKKYPSHILFHYNRKCYWLWCPWCYWILPVNRDFGHDKRERRADDKHWRKNNTGNASLICSFLKFCFGIDKNWLLLFKVFSIQTCLSVWTLHNLRCAEFAACDAILAGARSWVHDPTPVFIDRFRSRSVMFS